MCRSSAVAGPILTDPERRLHRAVRRATEATGPGSGARRAKARSTAGEATAPIAKTFLMDEIAGARDDMEHDRVTGKLVVSIARWDQNPYAAESTPRSARRRAPRRPARDARSARCSGRADSRRYASAS
jgi:hypothetical protein